jgi:aryl-alcohol dehydrogenase-like predicted oxidoreductase
MAVAWILSHQQVTSVIIGPRTVEQLKDSLGCSNIYFTEEENNLINSILL